MVKSQWCLPQWSASLPVFQINSSWSITAHAGLYVCVYIYHIALRIRIINANKVSSFISEFKMTNQPAYPLNELETSIVDNPPLRWLQQALRALADLHTFPVATALGATAWQRRWWECFLLPMHVICLRSICPPIYNNNNGQRPRDFNEALPERVSERRAATEMAAMQQWLV